MTEKPYKILLVEDDKLDTMAFLRAVADNHSEYDCATASSVAEAHRLICDHHFDVIIADYSLGDGSGIDVLNAVKNTPVIFVTGSGDEEVAVNAWKQGAYDYLVKDLEHNYLKTVPITIQNAIKHKHTEDHLRLLSHAIMSTDDSIYITDTDNKIIFVNRAFCQTYGYSEEQVIGKDADILWRGSENNDQPNAEHHPMPTAHHHPDTIVHKRSDGSEFPVSVSRSVVTDDHGNEIALLGVVRNIAEHLFTENLVRTLEKLKEGTRMVT
jgi:PAS domain S-box-containing protein